MKFVGEWYFCLGVPMFEKKKSVRPAQISITGKRKSAVPFSEEEIEIMINRFPHERTDKIAEELGRSSETISKKARQLGLKKTPEFKTNLARIRTKAALEGYKRYAEKLKAEKEASSEIQV